MSDLHKMMSNVLSWAHKPSVCLMEAPLQLAGPGQEGDPPGTDSTEVDIPK